MKTLFLALLAISTSAFADGRIKNSDINSAAAIVDTKLATISTAGKVSNSATTATKDNTGSTIVLRDPNGVASIGTMIGNVTGNLTGNASTATSANTATNATIAATASTASFANLANFATNSSIANTASTATAFVTNPTDCGALQFANAIDAQGNLTCSTPAGSGTSYYYQGYFTSNQAFDLTTTSNGNFAVNNSSNLTQQYRSNINPVSIYNSGGNLPGIVFTCPVAGVYRITMGGSMGCSGTANRDWYFNMKSINSVIISETGGRCTDTTNAMGSSWSTSGLLECDVNQTNSVVMQGYVGSGLTASINQRSAATQNGMSVHIVKEP